ncbi:hypothetical protein [Streptomyces chartreusis]|uniref:HEAT repeat domain-containing protein n=1 Tax=Streptomyces chartreusis TaxID=1969 RepID=A0A7H8TJW3_STRCX|nr:hypothetical protein [Streptomyces chartreusis]QKZ23811.1 hypothetical protein HUT05_44525 [Streptomyces chartreusis]
MSVPPRTRLYAALALLIMCTATAATYAGFALRGFWGAGAGTLAGVGVVLLCARITITLCRLQTEEHLKRIVVGDGKAEAVADAVLRAITLYEAAVFPLTPGGASTKEQQARRSVAYQLAAYDDLPLSVRVAAAEALEALDQGQDVKQTRATVGALAQAVRACRAGHVSIRDEQKSSRGWR